MGFKIQSNFNLETTKIKVHLIKALKRYLNEKNLTHVEKQQQFENLVHRVFKRTVIEEVMVLNSDSRFSHVFWSCVGYKIVFVIQLYVILSRLSQWILELFSMKINHLFFFWSISLSVLSD